MPRRDDHLEGEGPDHLDPGRIQNEGLPPPGQEVVQKRQRPRTVEATGQGECGAHAKSPEFGRAAFPDVTPGQPCRESLTRCFAAKD